MQLQWGSFTHNMDKTDIRYLLVFHVDHFLLLCGQGASVLFVYVQAMTIKLDEQVTSRKIVTYFIYFLFVLAYISLKFSLNGKTIPRSS